MKERILELREKGLSYNAISKQLGCSKGTISYHCCKLKNNDNKTLLNLDLKNKKQEKTNSFLLETDKIDLVLNFRKEKKTYKEIKELTGLSKYTISKISRFYGMIDSRKFGKTILSENDKLEMQLKYDEIGNYKKVAKLYNLSFEVVKKFIVLKTRIKKTNIEYKQGQVIGVVRWRHRTKQKLIDYLGGKCIMCGYKKCVGALEFHHKEPKEKDFDIGGKSWSFERLKNEADKCILVCSNCHKEIHYELNKQNQS